MNRLSVLPVLFLACLLAAGGAPAQQQKPSETPCGEFGTMAEARECAHREFKAADAELNAAYKQLAAKLDEADKERLKAAETAWLKYRDANCEYENSFYAGGSMRPMIHSFCLARMTRARTAELLQQAEDLEQ